ncbi:neutral zinc metallopeptidase [Olivibacter sp. CPCC 100613]|uniref:KPN_02809 family neutral zinc metallopeptidase n=1 Tax=Olivibacter sp. CPCC 100613 TaxID=3079931 RepID=UPI002FFC2963
MRWKGRRESDNFEDRRGMSGRGLAVGGGIGAIVIALIVSFLGGDPGQVLQQLQTAAPQQEQAVEISAEEKELTSFVRTVLASTEDVWAHLFQQEEATYQKPTLVVYRDQTSTECGAGLTAMGPFYCPADQKLFIDLSFNDELKNRFGAPGEFAMVYVIAHEVGHHIQHLNGTMDKVQQMRGRLSEKEYNKLSVKLELQADFLAGVWAHHANQLEQLLEEGDIEAGLQAANAIGDDKLQMQTQGQIVPDAFTHGTSAQRVYWFKKGYESGDINQGDTFNNDR